jgi:PAS domain S-box-containing protein
VTLTVDGYLLLVLTALLGALIAIIVYALVRFGAAARAARQQAHPQAPESALVTAAVQEAVARLRSQGREFQARAEASERLSDQIVASMTSGLLLVDVDGRIRVINPAGLRLLGLSDVAAGDSGEVLANVPALRDVLDEARRDGRPIRRRTIHYDDPRGGPRHLGLTLSPVTDGGGRLQSVICLFNDLTQVLALEEQLRLKDSLARLGELTAGIAHEFRNGLATIHGYARLMDPARLPGDYATCVQGIRAETDALREVVTNFLNFARPFPLTLTTVDVAVLVDRAADEIRGDVEAHGGSVAVQGVFPAIAGDEVLLRQALSNLCRNAADACSTVPRPPLISISGEAGAGETCRIVISDNGPGIEPALMDRIFQPFFTTRANGTGLGLALVQKIIVTHNGRVTAANRALGGASFVVELPGQQPGMRE